MDPRSRKQQPSTERARIIAALAAKNGFAHPSREALSRASGYSTKTVAKALAGSPDITPETTRRILRVLAGPGVDLSLIPNGEGEGE